MWLAFSFLTVMQFHLLELRYRGMEEINGLEYSPLTSALHVCGPWVKSYVNGFVHCPESFEMISCHFFKFFCIDFCVCSGDSKQQFRQQRPFRRQCNLSEWCNNLCQSFGLVYLLSIHYNTWRTKQMFNSWDVKPNYSPFLQKRKSILL